MLRALFNGAANLAGLGQMASYMARSVAKEVLKQVEPHHPTAVRLVRGATRAAGVPARVSGKAVATVASTATRSALRTAMRALGAANRMVGKGPKIFLPFLVGSLTLYAWDSLRRYPNSGNCR